MRFIIWQTTMVFTLADMTSYDTRHNMENGEENRDGSAYNYSWNCGVEGPDKKNVDSGTSKKTDEECHAAVCFCHRGLRCYTEVTNWKTARWVITMHIVRTMKSDG